MQTKQFSLFLSLIILFYVFEIITLWHYTGLYILFLPPVFRLASKKVPYTLIVTTPLLLLPSYFFLSLSLSIRLETPSVYTAGGKGGGGQLICQLFFHFLHFLSLSPPPPSPRDSHAIKHG